MGDVIGIGLTHYPMLATTDERMADLLRHTLTDTGIPEAEKDPAVWPEHGRLEWGDDQGVASAAVHRAALVRGLERTRQAVLDFQPDVLVVWGDDQYENFREEVIPSFCVLAYGDVEVEPLAILKKIDLPNVWGHPDGYAFTMRGAPDVAKTLVRSLLESGLDAAYSYEKREGIHFPHAFANTQLFLDYDNAGQDFTIPIVPIAVNCYGEHVISRRGGMARFDEIDFGKHVDPPGPSPERCFQLGQAVATWARATDLRVALVASSSWSHAFLNDKEWHLRPDTAADRALYDAMVEGRYDTWRAVTTRDVIDAGQHEVLNWHCLLGAMSELGLSLEWSDFVETSIFNSNKAFAVFR
ncbi:extradiol ring-cleavage dioxygenase [Nocardioides humi]|uniref:Extradiol ring-cleavage dioxygenase class III enzyme subunit B domain-containing protein n=1 Tax=Nocardioides humi TaxID=449461 RepID=A0ABN2BPW0_9ACTN|nr:extradiol ring-cleavage dioxygenase [Nocardioides humi]